MKNVNKLLSVAIGAVDLDNRMVFSLIPSCVDQLLAFGKGEFTQYPFFVRFRPFFYVFASP